MRSGSERSRARWQKASRASGSTRSSRAASRSGPAPRVRAAVRLACLPGHRAHEGNRIRITLGAQLGRLDRRFSGQFSA